METVEIEVVEGITSARGSHGGRAGHGFHTPNQSHRVGPTRGVEDPTDERVGSER